MIDIGLVLQGGGNGERFVPIDIPKPIFPLSWDKETCLGNILDSVPGYVPIFLHIQPKQREQYERYFKENEIRRDIFYLYQEESPVYSMGGEAITENERVLTVPNGPGSFRNSLREFVKKRSQWVTYFAVYDGCKTGICWDDVVSGAETLVAEKKGSLSYIKKLNEEQVETESHRRRYDRVLHGGVYDKKYSPSDIFSNPEATALTGLNIFNYSKFMDATSDLEGMLETYEERDTLAHYYEFRISRIINGFSSSERIFLEHDESHYFPSIKVPSDFERYWDFKKHREGKK